jgi:hypothetical protein
MKDRLPAFEGRRAQVPQMYQGRWAFSGYQYDSDDGL